MDDVVSATAQRPGQVGGLGDTAERLTQRHGGSLGVSRLRAGGVSLPFKLDCWMVVKPPPEDEWRQMLGQVGALDSPEVTEHSKTSAPRPAASTADRAMHED